MPAKTISIRRERIIHESPPAGEAATPVETARPFGDLEPAVRVGRFSRLKEHVTLGSFLRGARLPPGECVIYASREDAEALRVDLGGMRVVLARCPRLLPTTDRSACNIVPLAPIVLANVLRAHGAAVRIVDLHRTGRSTGKAFEEEAEGDSSSRSRCSTGIPSRP